MPVAKISFHPKDDAVVVAGKAFYVKDRLKKAGARWNPAAGVWTIKSDVATQDFLAELNALADTAIKAEKAIEKKAKDEAAALAAFYKTPAGKEQWWKEIEAAKKTPAGASAYYFICCKECVVIDWARKHTSCQACGHDGNTFFVRGSLYTGD